MRIVAQRCTSIAPSHAPIKSIASLLGLENSAGAFRALHRIGFFTDAGRSAGREPSYDVEGWVQYMNAEAFFLSQARIAGEAGFLTVHPPDPLTPGEAFARGADLYRQAIQFGLAAHAATGAPSDLVERLQLAATSESQLPELAVLLTATPHSTLQQWALTEAHLQRCIDHLKLDGYASYAALSEERQQNVCSDLGALHRAMMVALLPAESAAEVKRFKRDLVWFALGALMLIVCVGTQQVLHYRKLNTDLTLQATWSISSRYDAGCESPQQECSGGEHFFFHTRQEKNPWLMFDFKTSKSFSSIEVVNRLDCCGERANPLVISVSDDKKAWRLVAESRSEFTTFSASFPAVTARYLKLEVAQPAAMLHLSRVRVFP